MSKLLLNVLATATMLALPRPVYALDRCEALLGTKAHYTRFKRSLAKKMKVQIREVTIKGENVDEIVAGVYSRYSKTLKLDKDGPILEKKVTLHHEAVHVQNEHAFIKDPKPENAAMLIEFHRDEGVIDSRLDINYLNGFSIDEMKAYKKSSLYLSSIARDMKRRSQPDAIGFEKAAMAEQDDALTFARVSLDLLVETKSFLKKTEEKNLHLTVQRFFNESSDYFIAFLSLPQDSGEPLLVGFPYYEAGAQKRGEVQLKRKKLIQLCDEGIKLTKDYAHYLNIIVRD